MKNQKTSIKEFGCQGDCIGFNNGMETKHSIVQLREILGKSQRDFLQDVSGTYIGAVERGRSKVSATLSGKIQEAYGAWIAPGQDRKKVFEAFGPEWEDAQKAVEGWKRGEVLFVDDYGSIKDLEDAINYEEKRLQGKKTIKSLLLMSEYPPHLKKYGKGSYERFLEYKGGTKENLHAGHVREKGRQQLMELMKIAWECIGDDLEAELKLFLSLRNALHKTMQENEGLERKVKARYMWKLESIMEFCPGPYNGIFKDAAELNESCGFPSQILYGNSAEVNEMLAKLGCDPDMMSFFDSLPVPVSYENFKDWRASGMGVDEWREYYAAVKEEIISAARD